ncbi:hypothetical protein [Ruminiclostridium papyrosolvens]|uniref:Uncharacterized protein n=1 Tax=Ruminiclostridium papyrosolvens C7 TaxID=1330534 RepID=U4R4J3_9FIRM|nr:hypothetical protein [Ruminiclostridium papyrosolvens]EPR12955.1 hypothetical protein L323_06565 [Ruminiclostridium papyrosolvens C7]
MEDNYFNLKNILGILFKITKKNANILADRYLLKEVSIISKWKNNKAEIKSEDISRIVEFAVKESSEVQRKMIRKEILAIIDCSSITEEIKEMLIEIKDFGEFIEESLNVCTSWSYDVPDVNTSNGFTDKLSSGDEYDLDLEKGLEGGYKGIVRFDLELLKNKSNQESTGTKKNPVLKNSKINLIPKSKLGNAKKFIEARSILTVIVVVAILSYTFIQAGSNNKKVASDINQTQSSQSTYQVNDPAKAGPGDASAKAENVVPAKKSDEKKTTESRENDNKKQKKSPAYVDKSKDKTINRPETNNNIKTQTDQQNNDININISGSSDLNIGVGNNIIISNNESKEASEPSHSKAGTAESSAEATDTSGK